MKHSFLLSTAILLTSLTFGACSSDDDEEKTAAYTLTTVSNAPLWQINWEGNDAYPDWEDPDPSIYENWAVILVQLEDELKPYVSEDDMLAVFVGNELRGLSQPAIFIGDNEDEISAFFLIKAYGNETDAKAINVTIRYYNSRLKQIFTRSSQFQLKAGAVFGIDEDVIPQFTLGSSKYPVVFNFGLAPLYQQLTTISPSFAPQTGDLVAAFVGEECRGCYTYNSQLPLSSSIMTIYARNRSETFTLKYYQYSTNTVYSFTNPMKIEN